MCDIQQAADYVQKANNKSDLKDHGGILEHDKIKHSPKASSVVKQSF